MVECIGEMRIAKKLTTTWTSQHCNWIEPTKQGNYTMKIHQKKSQKKVVVLELKEYSVHPVILFSFVRSNCSSNW